MPPSISEWQLLNAGFVLKTLAALIAILLIVWVARGKHPWREVVARGGVITFTVAMVAVIASGAVGLYARSH